jgi:hypothetical protein
MKRFLWLKKKLSTDHFLKQKYHQFITDYINEGLMSRVPDQLEAKKRHIIFPHHGVYKKSDPTAKIRVVFDASAESSRGYSFYESTMKGPTEQRKIKDILLGFRAAPFAMVGDIKKMYPQF